MKATRKISNEKINEYFYYSEGFLLWKKGPYARHKVGWIRKDGKYLQCQVEGQVYYVHRLIWQLHNGRKPLVIDHINRDSLDNRIENLREVTHSLNCWNSKINARNKTGVRGVHFCIKLQKYVAMIQIKKQRKNLGSFETLEEAKKVYENEYNKRNKELKTKDIKICLT